MNPITKRKLPTFESNAKAVIDEIKDQLVQVKKEQRLRHGVKVGPGPQDPGPWDPGSPSKFKSGTWDRLNV